MESDQSSFGTELGTLGKKWSRAYRACLNCKARKIKCDLGPPDNPHDPPCLRCKRERKECVFPSPNAQRISKRKLQEVEDSLNNSDTLNKYAKYYEAEGSSISQRDYRGDRSDCPSVLGTMQGALEFLAKAAASVAKQGSKSKSDLAADCNYIKLKCTKFNKMLTEEIDEKTPYFDGESSEDWTLSKSTNCDGVSSSSTSFIDDLRSMKSKRQAIHSDIDYIGPEKLLSRNEACAFIDVFFTVMHPFYPYVPLQLHNFAALQEYPILLVAILTISSRYHSFGELGLEDNNNHNRPRNIDVHEKLWTHCQRLMSRTVWAEASTRSIGTVLALLLFTEWNPRAVHWRHSDYANSDDIHSNKNSAIDSTDHECLTGQRVLRRSNRMAWMLSGTAVRLAQDMGFLKCSSKIFVAAHASEIKSAITMNQPSNLLNSLSEIVLNAHEKFSDEERASFDRLLEKPSSRRRWDDLLESLDKEHLTSEAQEDLKREFLNDEYALSYVDPDAGRLAPETGGEIKLEAKFTFAQRAKIELLRIAYIGYESIYREHTKSVASPHSHRIAILNVLSPLMESWLNTYRPLIQTCADQPISLKTHCEIDREGLRSGFYYCRLYFYSFALQFETDSNGNKKLRPSDITRSAHYVDQACAAAIEVLDSALRVHALHMLKYMPVQWVTRIVRSVAFIVKCYLTLRAAPETASLDSATRVLMLSMIPGEEIVQKIQSIAVAMREASPDLLHLCFRFSKVLMYLCTELTSRAKSDVAPAKRSQTKATSPETALHDNEDEDDHDHDHHYHNPSVSISPPPPPAEPTHAATDLLDWFMTSEEVGLDFVAPWTEMIEQQFIIGDLTKTYDTLYNEAMGFDFNTQ
ncbi:LAMI_0D11496g1_1 [Lachancea mirantina]|uniref:LAMI_0D11496g1_1 n=1 Tax=Lachancea mirantina TaxID=1230905 RepID=A0A1G4JF20_9SACH|nr:LAMI_0D11496g1_1 [Lachancea mirantina]